MVDALDAELIALLTEEPQNRRVRGVHGDWESRAEPCRRDSTGSRATA